MDPNEQRYYQKRDEGLAYGDNYGENEDGPEGERGFIGDTFKKYKAKYAPSGPDAASSQQAGSGSGGHIASSIFSKVHGAVHDVGKEINHRLARRDTHSHTHAAGECDQGLHSTHNRYLSFAPLRQSNEIKWHVDGCSYMWAVSRALEQATQTIWILDWWLSPELYLRRPPAKNEQYRVDRMLEAAAQRGVKVNIIVYKEVTQALTLSSSHTKHHLENLHPNIAVFRHPDHLPDAQTLSSSFISSLQNISLSAKKAASLPMDALKGIYGMNEDVILYWAHHEKLCLVDGQIAFMGGLDLCYGRWDTNQHPIADCHPSNLEDIVFPGQDYNNARIMDFQDVSQWQDNKLDRKESSRMGWSDISVSLKGPVVEDLKIHFAQRWNFIFQEKYNVRKDARYARLPLDQEIPGTGFQQSQQQSQPQPQSQGAQAQYPPPPPGPPPSNQAQPQYFPPPPSGPPPSEGGQVPYFPPPPQNRGVDDISDQTRGIRLDSTRPYEYRQQIEEKARGFGRDVRERFDERKQHLEGRYGRPGQDQTTRRDGIQCQIVRSCSKWSHGVSTEHSIANAYISIIENSQHFVYVENQFFITATDDKQSPVQNKIGKAMVDRILRAARAGQKYKMIIVIPSVPAFAGDLRDDASLGTRAIMEFQYNSINRGGHSIMECVANAGYNPTEYIRFYNLRNYDRINVGEELRQVEELSGVNYGAAQQAFDQVAELPADSTRGFSGPKDYERFQQSAGNVKPPTGGHAGRWDTVSECYMLDGPDIRSIPWSKGNYSEMDAFVSEELYVHSKVLIADDRVVICGSANLNDRSQLGDHDSEIAIIVEDADQIDTTMNGQPWRATRFAATLRRELFRKHLGLLPRQDMERPDANFDPIWVSSNVYDFGSPEDRIVSDPLSDTFLALWNSRARTNTEVFSKVFHPVPDDKVKTWKDYDEFYEHFFKAGKEKDGEKLSPSKYQWGHVVAEEFAPGDEGVRQMKDELSKIKGTLVEMPLTFLIKEDIAVEGLSLNAFTEEVYT